MLRASKKKIVFSRGKILEILYLQKGYNYDYKKMLGLVICYFNNNQLFFQVLVIPSKCFTVRNNVQKQERFYVILLLET